MCWVYHQRRLECFEICPKELMWIVDWMRSHRRLRKCEMWSSSIKPTNQNVARLGSVMLRLRARLWTLETTHHHCRSTNQDKKRSSLRQLQPPQTYQSCSTQTLINMTLLNIAPSSEVLFRLNDETPRCSVSLRLEEHQGSEPVAFRVRCALACFRFLLVRNLGGLTCLYSSIFYRSNPRRDIVMRYGQALVWLLLVRR